MFVDVKTLTPLLCLKAKYVYVITRSGLLCQVNDQRLLEKWVELKVER